MAIKVEKLNSMSVTVVTVNATKYDITAEVVYNNNVVNRFEMGRVMKAGETYMMGNELANFNSNGSMSITFQNSQDITVMKEIMDAVDAFITEVKNTPLSSLNDVTPTV